MPHDLAITLLVFLAGCLFWGIKRMLSSFMDRLTTLEKRERSTALRLHDIEQWMAQEEERRRSMVRSYEKRLDS